MQVQVIAPTYKYTINAFFMNRQLRIYGFEKCANVPGLPARAKENTQSTIKRLREHGTAIVYHNGRALKIKRIETKLDKLIKCLK